MKQLFFVILTCFTIYAHSQGSWLQKSNLGTIGRQGAAAFSIGTKGYVGGGNDGVNDLQDFWEWDQSNDVWTQKSNIWGGPRMSPVAFSIGNYGYLGCGQTTTPNIYLQDFWRYDPIANSWVARANYPTPMSGMIGLSSSTKGYAVLGYNGSGQSSLFEYDPSTDTWTIRSPFPGGFRTAATGFYCNNKVFVGTGVSNGPVLNNDFWEYDPVTDVWTQRVNFGGTPRQTAVGFAIGNKGYIGTGYDGVWKQDFWEYDPMTNVWVARAFMPGPPRWYAFGVGIGNKGYIGTGAINFSAVVNDFWEYSPALSVPDEIRVIKILSYPNPFTTHFIINLPDSIKGEFDFRLISISGRCVMKERLKGDVICVERGTITSGTYHYIVRTNQGTYSGSVVAN